MTAGDGGEWRNGSHAVNVGRYLQLCRLVIGGCSNELARCKPPGAFPMCQFDAPEYKGLLQGNIVRD